MHLACYFCNESILDDPDHVCDRLVLQNIIKELELSKRNLETERHQIRETLLQLMADNAEKIENSTHPHMKILQEIWKSTDLCCYDGNDIIKFSKTWMEKQMILCGVIELFSNRPDGRGNKKVYVTLVDLFNRLAEFFKSEKTSEEEYEKWQFLRRTPEMIAKEISSDEYDRGFGDGIHEARMRYDSKYEMENRQE